MTTWLATILLHFLWQGTLITAVVAMALAVARRSEVRHDLALAGLLAMGIAPMLTAVLTRPSASPALDLTVAPEAPWTAPLVACWALGVSALSCRVVIDLIRLQRMRTTAIAAPPDLSARFERLAAHIVPGRAVSLGLVSAPWSAMATGIVRSMVLLPAPALATMSVAQIEAILAHELAHLRRHDAAIELYTVLIETALFYQPGVWWLSRILRHERELCCDDLAVQATGDALLYARALTELQATRALYAVPASQGGDLTMRVQRLLGRPQGPPSSPRWPVLAATFATAAAALAATGEPTVVISSPISGPVHIQLDDDLLTVDLGDQAIYVPFEGPEATIELQPAPTAEQPAAAPVRVTVRRPMSDARPGPPPGSQATVRPLAVPITPSPPVSVEPAHAITGQWSVEITVSRSLPVPTLHPQDLSALSLPRVESFTGWRPEIRHPSGMIDMHGRLRPTEAAPWPDWQPPGVGIIHKRNNQSRRTALR